jgi:two-component system sensor histidine kinase SenX3
MQTSTALMVGGVFGALLGAVTVLAWRLSERAQGRAPSVNEPLVPPGVAAVLSVLRSSALLIGPDDEVLKASAPSHVLGVVRGSRLAVPDLLEMVHLVRRDGQIREGELVLRRTRSGPSINVAARVAPLGSRLVLVLVEDRTRERRVEAIRRDFVANVSHELKTPVGALNLLAEAVGQAADDPEAVIRFAARMQMESERLTRLVKQIIELSRLQGDDPLEDATGVLVDEIV